MAVQQSLARTSTSIGRIQESIVSLNKNFSQTQKTAVKINSTLIKSNESKQSYLRLDSANFAKRREAVRRKEAEDIVESSTVGGVIKRQGQVATTSTKGLLGRILDAVGLLMVGFLIQNLPIIISLGSQLINRMQSLIGVLSSWFQNLQATIGGFGNLLKGVLSNVSRFDFTDQSGEISRSMTEIQKGVRGMEDDFDDAIALLKQPFDFSIQEQEEQTKDPPSDPGTSDGSQPTTTYVSQGGKILDPDGRDYGQYIRGGIGSRGKTRVHGADKKTYGHTGEDYPMPMRTPLTMIAPGTVYDAVKGNRFNGGYGEFVVIQLDDGRLVRLGHLDQITVKKGERVGANSGPNGTAKVVGFSGQTGLKTGPHLHLDIAKSYDPVSYMVSGTEDPFPFTQGGGLVQGQNVKATGETRTQTPSAPPASSSKDPKGSPSGTGPNGTAYGVNLKALADATSAAEGNYNSVGPTTYLGHGLGRYQFMTGRSDVQSIILNNAGNEKSKAQSLINRSLGGDRSAARQLLKYFSPKDQDALFSTHTQNTLAQIKRKYPNADEFFLVQKFGVYHLTGGDYPNAQDVNRTTGKKHGDNILGAYKKLKGNASSSSQAQVSSSPRSNPVSNPPSRAQQFFVPMPTNQSTSQPQSGPSGGDGINFPDVSEDIRSVLEQLQNFSLIN